MPIPKQSATRPLDIIIGRGILTTEALLDELRAKLAERAANYRTYRGNPLAMASLEELIEEYEPLIAENIFSTDVAAWIQSLREVEKKLPPWAFKKFSDRKGLGGFGAPPIKPPTIGPFSLFGDSPREPLIRFPVLEKAIDSLLARNVVDRATFDAMTAAERGNAFTIARESKIEVIGRIRNALAETIDRGASLAEFKKSIQGELEASFIGPGHMCFLPGTMAEGNIVAASKMRYDGPAVQIEAFGGYVLRVTANHPILTSIGWKYASDIQDGDDLVCYGDPVKPLDIGGTRPSWSKWGAVNNQDAPLAVEDIFDSISRHPSTVSDIVGPVSPLDFYGDAAFSNGYVSRVGSNGKLMNAINSSRYKLNEKISLMLGDTKAPLNSSSTGGSLLDLRGFGSLSASIERANSTCRIAKSSLSFVGTKSVPTGLMVLGLSSQIDSSIFKATSKRLGGDVKLARDLMKAFPGVVSTNRVVKVERIRWSGHVYDLQTSTGFVVSNGIISGNSTVFRTNVQNAFSEGHWEISNDPIVAEIFPYREYLAIHDTRARETHLALEKLGLSGTNVYRADDLEFWNNFLPSWDFSCRCGTNMLTIEQAAERGVFEAKTWLRTGVKPPLESRLQYIPFRPPAGFVRGRRVAA